MAAADENNNAAASSLTDLPLGKDRVIYPNPGGKTRSKVWEYFGFYKTKDGPPTKDNLDMTTAVCRLCEKTYINKGNTTNFKAHIDSEHKVRPEKSVPSSTSSQSETTVVRQTLLTDPFTRNKLGPERKKCIDEAPLRLIVGKCLPTSLVDSIYFKEFVKALEPRYNIPSRKTIMDRLEGKRVQAETKIQNDLASLHTSQGVGITHDGWTSSATESYNTTTIHYIKDWTIKSAVLNTIKMEGSHTGEKIAASLLEVKAKWNLPDCVATTDNAANEKRAFEILGWHRFGCYGHRLNLVVKNAMSISEMSKILGKSRKLVTLFHTSTSVNDKLMEKQKLLLSEKEQGHKLISDVATRWNSSLEMLKRILEQAPAIMAVATDESVSKNARSTLQNCTLTFEESSLAEKVVVVLEPFKRATESLCSETNPTINKVQPIVTKLLKALEEDDNDPPAVKELKKTMRKQMNERTEVEDFPLLGTILNPFTRNFTFDSSLTCKAEELLLTAMKDLAISFLPVTVKKEEQANQAPTCSSTTTSLPPMPSLPVPPEGMGIIDTSQMTEIREQDEQNEMSPKPKRLKSADTEDWLSDVMCVGESVISKDDLLQEEIRRYLGVVLKYEDKGLTVLEWWKKNEMFFPRISVLARNVLCIQASSVPAERVFSLAGNLVSKKRSRLSPDNVDLFIFLNKNIGKYW